MSTPWVKFLFWIYLLFLVWAFATVLNWADPDLWHRLAVGEYLWQHHQFPLGDTFSYLSDYVNVPDHEWGSALAFYGLWCWDGGTAIVAMKLFTLALTLMLTVWAGLKGRRPTALFAAFYALVLLALLPSFQGPVASTIFTHLIFALWLFWFQYERHHLPVPPLFYVLTMVLWANLHGGFVVGLAWLLAVTLVQAAFGYPWKTWALRFVLCSLATLINPFGWQLWVITARALVVTRRGFNEWAPVTWLTTDISYFGYKLLFVCVILALVIQISRRGWKDIDRPSVILIGFFMALAIDSARHTSLFALVAGALLPDFFPLRWPHILVVGPVRRLVVMAMSSALVLIPLYSALIVLPEGKKLELEYPPIDCPVDAIAFLQRENIQGKLLVPFNYGSYALWHLRGKMRVSMDGRYDLVYRPETYNRVDDFFHGKESEKSLLTKPAPDAILVPCEDAVYPTLRQNPGWTEAWHDSVDAVFLPLKTAPL